MYFFFSVFQSISASSTNPHLWRRQNFKTDTKKEKEKKMLIPSRHPAFTGARYSHVEASTQTSGPFQCELQSLPAEKSHVNSRFLVTTHIMFHTHVSHVHALLFFTLFPPHIFFFMSWSWSSFSHVRSDVIFSYDSLIFMCDHIVRLTSRLYWFQVKVLKFSALSSIFQGCSLSVDNHIP